MGPVAHSTRFLRPRCLPFSLCLHRPIHIAWPKRDAALFDALTAMPRGKAAHAGTASGLDWTASDADAISPSGAERRQSPSQPLSQPRNLNSREQKRAQGAAARLRLHSMRHSHNVRQVATTNRMTLFR